MKLDRENSKKNICAENLDVIEEKMEKVETSIGNLKLSATLVTILMICSALKVTSSTINSDLDVALGILSIAGLGFGGFVLEKILRKLSISQKELEKLEIEEDKILCNKKSNIIYFPQK